MKESDISALGSLLSAKFEEERLQVNPILEKEKRLRCELKRLEELEIASRSSDKHVLLMRPFGGDVAWQIWINQKRRKLTGELARVMAAKLEKTREMRLAYGRIFALQAIQKEASSRHTQALVKQCENQMLSGIWR